MVEAALFSTRDLYLASALITAGCKLRESSREDNVVLWKFEARGDAVPEEIQIEWLNDDLELPARSYAESIKNLKSSVHPRSR